MALVFVDRVKEKGTGVGDSADIVLSASGFDGYQLLSSSLSDGDQVDVLILDSDNAATGWEVSRCTYTASGTTLNRSTGTCLASSNSGAFLVLTAGTHSIAIVNSADNLTTLNVESTSLDGLAFDKPSMTVVNDSGLKLDVENVNTGDMRFLINGVISTLDCTTGSGVGGKARVSLTAGADENTPQINYIYATDTDGTATLSASTSLPSGAFSWIGKLYVTDANSWSTIGSLVIQRFTEAFSNDSRGTQSHTREKLRASGAVYSSGVLHSIDITTNGASADNVHLTSSSGVVYQLHRQSFPAFSTGPYYYGNGTNQFEEISDLNAALAEIDGTSLSGTRFNLLLWGAVNLTTGDCKVFVNLPDGSYSKDADAIADPNNTADYSVPDEMRSVAFLICRVALRHTTTDAGTWEELGLYSLLGNPVGVRNEGSGAIASNEYDDAKFRIYDNTDPTKEIAFQANGITTATTRTLTIPDKSMTLGEEIENSYTLTTSATGTQTIALSSAFDSRQDPVTELHPSASATLTINPNSTHLAAIPTGGQSTATIVVDCDGVTITSLIWGTAWSIATEQWGDNGAPDFPLDSHRVITITLGNPSGTVDCVMARWS